MRAFLKRAFTENAPLKAVALILSITLFILVRGDKETERHVRVAVAYIKPEGRQIVGDLPQAIEVRVRGPWTRIKRLDASTIDPVLVDLTNAAEGDFPLDDAMVTLPPGLRVASMKPSKIFVELARQKKVPIVPVLVDTPAEGTKVDGWTVVPQTALVTGPRAKVDPIVELKTQPISVADRTGGFVERVAVLPPPEGVSFSGEAVTQAEVQVRIGEEADKRVLTGLPVVIRAPAGTSHGKLLATVEPASVDLVLRGLRHVLRKVDEHAIVASVGVHIEDLTTGTPRPATVVVEGIPAGVAVEVHPRQVLLTPAPQAGNRPRNAP
jgi:YbbR domain-containing protein